MVNCYHDLTIASDIIYFIDPSSTWSFPLCNSPQTTKQEKGEKKRAESSTSNFKIHHRGRKVQSTPHWRATEQKSNQINCQNIFCSLSPSFKINRH
jgi:hypothetical protein